MNIQLLTLIISIHIFAEASEWSDLNRLAKEQLPDIFAGDNYKITKFAIIGELIIFKKPYRVVESLGVIPGMMAPRGQQWLLIFDGNNKIVKLFSWGGQVSPLWCEGSKLYLFGMCTVPGVPAKYHAVEEADTGNVIDFSNGPTEPILLRENMYGSSGGIEDNVIPKP